MSYAIMNKYAALIGSDEAGKGEWLGPMTIAAVALTPQQSLYLVTQGVIDSKKLRLETIIDLSEVIRGSCLGYHVVTISPESFDRLMSEVKGEGRSLNDILAWGHAKAISEVLEELMRKGLSGKIKLSIDQFDRLKTEERLKRVLELRRLDFEQYPKAESETHVAAAGILARAVRELWIDEKSRKMKLDLRKLSANEALLQPNVESFAKMNFLKHR